LVFLFKITSADVDLEINEFFELDTKTKVIVLVSIKKFESSF